MNKIAKTETSVKLAVVVVEVVVVSHLVSLLVG